MFYCDKWELSPESERLAKWDRVAWKRRLLRDKSLESVTMSIHFVRQAGVPSRAAALGFVAGLRSRMPLALLAVAANRGDGGRLGESPVAMLRKPAILTGLGLAAAGEAIADKLPVTSSRLEAAPLGGRLFFGALSGSFLSRDRRAPIVVGAALGAVGALAGSYAGYHARGYLGRVTGLPDALWAGVEDAAAFGLGLLATRRVA